MSQIPNQPDQQGEQPPTRGRGIRNRGRGRSRSRTNGGGRNYGSTTFQNQVAQQNQNVSQILQDNQARSQAAKDTKKDVSPYIEQGKALVSKFFRGFEQQKRGNIEVVFDDTFPERIAEVYHDRISQHAEMKLNNMQPQPAERKKRRYIKRFAAGITLATAIKLYRSSTDLEKTSNYNLNMLHSSKILVPEKAAVLINQIGKTDLKDDNRIRIVNQHMACKRMLVKSLLRFMSQRKVDGYLTEKDANNLTTQHLYGFVFSDNFPKMIDNSLKSLQLLKDFGKEYFLEKSQLNYQISVNSVTQAQVPAAAANVNFNIRLPAFDFEDVTEASVIAYLNNPLFSVAAGRHFNWADNLAIVNIICALVFQIAKGSWLRDPNRQMANIDNRFANTFIGNVTFLAVLNSAGIYNINNWITDADLNELVSMELHKWNTADTVFWTEVIKFQEIQFSDFGSDSQMVEIPQDAVDAVSTFDNVNRYNIKRKPVSKSALKISETGAIFGVMGRFIKKLKMTSDFTISHDSNNRNILREFLKTDIKH